MKAILLVAAVFLLVSPYAPGQGKSTDPVGQAVLKLDQQWVDALLKSDTAFLEKLYTDDLIYVHSSGSVDNKTVYIDNIRTGKSKYQSIEREDIKVSVYGDAAVVTSRWAVKILNNGNLVNVNGRYIHVYVKQKGVWKMAAHQSTRMA
jgi:ketosteroid isomerase-like protein